ncbi:hypothetical protein F383_33639 [Gossypium arboreum]|uniref:Uncharacterized protein n=1 Tax=Gossypium arboreum TaxID=29729 RepID=A0A0B0N565_GOSAR|nr:hypothetical protein F383_33639 [Gossypium arboreum]
MASVCDMCIRIRPYLGYDIGM